MSRSFKLTSISQTVDYIARQLQMRRDLEQHLRNARAIARLEAEKVAKERTDAIKRDLDAQLQAGLYDLSLDMTAMDRRHQAAMKRQADTFIRDLGQLRDWSTEKITQLDVKMDEVDREMTEIKKGMAGLYAKEAGEQEQAARMLKDLQSLSQAINVRSMHDKYVPGEWQHLHEKIDSLATMKIPSASVIAQALNLTYALWDLEQKCLKEQLRFEAIHNYALDQVVELLHIMHQNRQSLAFKDKDGSPMTDEKGGIVKVELDFWTRGAYPALEKEIQALREELESKDKLSRLSASRLEEILKLLEEKSVRQQSLVQLSLERGFASEERVKISEEIINAMEEEGFRLNMMADGTPANNYLGGEMPADQREGVFAILENPATHTAISIIIEADEERGQNQIALQRNDQTAYSEDELRRTMIAIQRTIGAKGYKMGNPEDVQGVADQRREDLADPEALLRAGIREETRQNIGLPSKSTANAGKKDQ